VEFLKYFDTIVEKFVIFKISKTLYTIFLHLREINVPRIAYKSYLLDCFWLITIKNLEINNKQSNSFLSLPKTAQIVLVHLPEP
jgi:hypothetical protein